MCSSQKAHCNSVLERLGFSVQRDTLPSPQPSDSPRRRPESSLQGERIRSHVSPLNEEDSGQAARANQMLYENDPFFEKKLYMGSLMAINACTLAKLAAKNRSPSPASSVDSLRSVDTHTPDELRAISQLNSFSPTPPAAATKRPSRLPLMYGKWSNSSTLILLSDDDFLYGNLNGNR